MGKLFVWDLHGTLEKGNDALVLELSNEALLKFGYERRLTWEEALHLSGRKWHEYFAHVLPDASVEDWKKLESTAIHIAQSDDRIERHMQANDYAMEVLERIKTSAEQIVISNTSSEGLKRFLAATGLSRFFPEGYAFAVHDPGSSRTKLDALKGFVEGRKFSRKIAIGDSAHDMLGDVNYLYTHPGRKHRDCHAHYKIHDLREILREL